MSYLFIEDFDLKKSIKIARKINKDANKEIKNPNKINKRKSKDDLAVTANIIAKKELNNKANSKNSNKLISKNTNLDKGSDSTVYRLKNEKGLPVKNY